MSAVIYKYGEIRNTDDDLIVILNDICEQESSAVVKSKLIQFETCLEKLIEKRDEQVSLIKIIKL